ncbi:MAG TPA: hypothetical protein VI386_38315 [Candidatus Sulfotelmatobacter sp.]
MFPVFLAYLIFEAIEEFCLYALDVIPSVSNTTFWSAFCVGRVAEGLLKFAVIGEIFRRLSSPWATLGRLGYRLVTGIGGGLVVCAALAAAYTPIDNPQFAIVSRAHVLEQTFYIIQSGLVLFLFVFASHFKLTWDSRSFGIALGFGVLSCEHLATWAVMASGALLDKRHLLDFLNATTYHLCVLIWFYFLLLPEKKPAMSEVSLPENNLAVWNRELERLLQQ